MRALDRGLGLGALLAALALAAFAIPNWVATPKAVANPVLSPRFWPWALAGLLAAIGLGLLAPRSAESPTNDAEPAESPAGGAARLAAMGGVMAAMLAALPILGMVWTSMLAFLAVAWLGGARRPAAMIACAILAPLALYAFFAHLAGVAVPQGRWIRLP